MTHVLKIYRWILPSLLLVIIALAQVVCSTWGSLTHWKGGGFGMFSTYDSEDARFLKVYILSDSNELPASVPDEFSRDELLIQTWPRQSELQKLAEDLARRSWLISPLPRRGLESNENQLKFPDLAKPDNRTRVLASTTQPDKYPNTYERIHVTGIRVDVWKMKLDSGNKFELAEKWMSATATVPGKGGT